MLLSALVHFKKAHIFEWLMYVFLDLDGTAILEPHIITEATTTLRITFLSVRLADSGSGKVHI